MTALPVQPVPASGWRGRSRRAAARARMPRWPLPDFLPARPRPSLLAWSLCGAGGVCLALAAAQTWQQHRALDEAVTMQARWQHELARLAAASAPVPATPAAPEPSARARAEAARVAHRLSHRWDRVLQPIEQAGQPGVQWLRLAHDVDSGGLQLEGQLPAREEALRLANRLGAAPGWGWVVLQRVELPAEAAAEGASAVRFQLAARVGPAEDAR